MEYTNVTTRRGRPETKKMSLEKLKTMVINIRSDISDFHESYPLDDVQGEDECLKYVENLEILKKEHRRIFNHLQEMGADSPENFPNYEIVKDDLNQKFKLAVAKLRDIRKGTFDDLCKREEIERLNSRKKISTEFHIFSSRLEEELSSYKNVIDIDFDEAERFLIEFRGQSVKLDVFHGDISSIFDGSVEKNDLDQQIKLLHAGLKEAILFLQTHIRNVKNDKVLAEQRARNEQIMACSMDLYAELKARYDTLLSKCAIDISQLGDNEILQFKKREDALNLELREFIDKITSYTQYVAPCRDLAENDISTLNKMREIVVDKLHDTFAKINDRILQDDITEEKLKSATEVDIELKKFKGHTSEMDVYTFKEQFKKYVEPHHQRKLLPDILKNKYLTGNAYTLVAKIDDLETIWEKLIGVFGNTQLLLQNKLGFLEKFSNLEKMKDDEKIVYSLSGLLNAMSELKQLAEKYKLEGNLYYGGGLHKVLKLIGEQRQRKFIKSLAKRSLSQIDEKEKWVHLSSFLNDERVEREMFVVNEKAMKNLCLDPKKEGKHEPDPKDKGTAKSGGSKDSGYSAIPGSPPACHICDKTEGHKVTKGTDGVNQIEYIACKKFVDMNPAERTKILFDKGLCARCLKPGAKRAPDHECDKKYLCNNKFKDRQRREKTCLNHVLVCNYHKDKQNNKDLFTEYKNKVILERASKFDQFTKDVAIACYAAPAFSGKEVVTKESVPESFKEKDEGSPIFMLQRIAIDGVDFNLFFDNGCGDMIVSKAAVEELVKRNRAAHIKPGPLTLVGVNDITSVCEHGKYSIKLPMANGEDATMNGLCLDRITHKFPAYPLKEVEEDFRSKLANKDSLTELPSLPEEVGGEISIMIGSKYMKYFPTQEAKIDSGLTLYRSVFNSKDMTNGVINGPHPIFTDVELAANFNRKMDCYVQEARVYLESIKLSDSVPLLGSKCDVYHSDEVYAVKKRTPAKVRIFEEVEQAGTECSYRCPDCRGCPRCKQGSLVEDISIEKEVEQKLIEDSVSVDFENKVSSAKLPFLADPDKRLSPNMHIARKVYDGVVKQCEKRAADCQDVIESEGKLQALGFVCYLDDLDEETRKSILESPLMHFIPWRVVWSDTSLSTKVRLVFDASAKTPSGCSINELLALGANNMNNLIHILIRWSTRLYALHTDVTKMYNVIQLDKAFWRYQLYLWEKDLDPKKEPFIKVIMTLIYGVKPSGNQAEVALRKVAAYLADKYPIASKVIFEDIYVDDCISGAHTLEARNSLCNDLELVMEQGGFKLKGFTFSGIAPNKVMSADGESTHVGGYKYYPEADQISLNINDLNFARRVRGRKSGNVVGKVPEKLTKRHCASRVAECFDPRGLCAPLIAGFKQDISILHETLGWDDALPDSYRQLWENNFEMIEEMRSLRYNRAVVPADAKNLDIQTIDTGDASSKIICAAIYARFEKKDGTFSCQLIFSRTKILPKDISIPRAELQASVLNATTGHVVKLSLKEMHASAMKLTDSQVTLHWISSVRAVLKPFVRNRVIEVNRLSPAALWRYVESTDMIADVGTRKGLKISDVAQDSTWINGLSWMSGPSEDFPVRTVEQVKLDNVELQKLKKEQLDLGVDNPSLSQCHIAYARRHVREKIRARYDYSKYLIDPNRRRFRTVVRVLSLVLLFVRKCAKNIRRIQESRIFAPDYPGKIPVTIRCNDDRFIVTNVVPDGGKHIGVVQISDAMMKAALHYFARKATKELKKFVDKRKYTNISKEIDGVLYYTGRIPTDALLSGYPELCEAALDLSPTTFCVPMMDLYSPIAFAIAMEIHWFHDDVQHQGIESMLRHTEYVSHIIGGRDLHKTIKDYCRKCRILEKDKIEVTMGSIQRFNLCIAPCFYACQIDIFGPLKSYSNVNKRASVKVWFLIFCCCTTGAVDVRVMDDYSTDAFVEGFIRFSCRFGYPKTVLPDEGSQLVKGCKDMEYSFIDSKQVLHREFGVDFRTCPVGAHYVHGKVERKIQQVKKSLNTKMNNEKLSILQWETLMQQISNSINNLPIGMRNRVEKLENLDLITPNRLILGRNNNRCPNEPLTLAHDVKKIIETNEQIFSAWFKAWLTSYVPNLVDRPKWHRSDDSLQVGDVVLFLKSEQEFDLQYQYGMVSDVLVSDDTEVRQVEVEYVNHNENGVRRKTKRGVRDLVLIHSVDDLDLYHELAEMIDDVD